MTPEDKELVDRLNEGGCGVNCDTLCSSAAATIERLSAEVAEHERRVETLKAGIDAITQVAADAQKELAANRQLEADNKRLSAERDREKFLREFSEEVCMAVQNQREAYRAISSALRAQIAEAEPVAWQGVEDPTDLYWRKPVQADVRPLYLHPAADANAAALETENKELMDALDRLARLGNEPHYGNSIGNQIARAALGKSRRGAL